MRFTILLFMISGMLSLHAQNKVPANAHFWYSMETTASPQAIWSVWTDVPNWKNWDTGLKDASVTGEFTLAAKGVILSLENRKSRFKVVEYTEGESYTYKTKLPFGSLYVKRYLKTQNGVTTFTHEVWFKGLTRGIFARAYGKEFREMLPQVLLNIKNIVETHDYH